MPKDQAFALPEDAQLRRSDGLPFLPDYFHGSGVKMASAGVAAIERSLSIEPNAGSAEHAPAGANFGTRIAATFLPPTPGIFPRRSNGATED